MLAVNEYTVQTEKRLFLQNNFLLYSYFTYFTTLLHYAVQLLSIKPLEFILCCVSLSLSAHCMISIVKTTMQMVIVIRAAIVQSVIGTDWTVPRMSLKSVQKAIWWW